MSQPITVDNEINQSSAKLSISQPDTTALSYEIPVIHDVHGNPYLLASNLYSETGITILDEGLRSTAAAESKITRIIPAINKENEAPKGALQYRGYNAKDLATSCTFLETAYLLIQGDLPDESAFKEYSDNIKTHRIIDKQTEETIESFERSANPMLILQAAMTSLAARYEHNYDMNNAEDRQELATRLIAKIPTITAHIFKHSIGQRPIAPDENLGHTANFLHMLLSTQATMAEVDQSHIKILDMILTLHADHQMAVSTFVARSVSSAGTPSISSINAAIAALSGPLHGGANERVIEMLSNITEEQIPEVIAKAKDKNDPFKLYGFGHRVYKGMDPRAEILRELALNIIQKSADNSETDPMFKIALKLEEAALNDEYFKDRNLYPNVDFYSGLALKAIGIPTELFTVIFAMSRTAGWLAHIEESWNNKAPLYRPKQYYTGLKERPLNWP